MDEEDIIPADPLAIDAAVVVSETDAAHSHSEGDEEEGWLARRYQRRRLDGAGSTINETSNDEEDDSDDDAEMNDPAGPGDLYSKNMDDEDAAWVYKHMRGGTEELVRVRRRQQQSDATMNKKLSDGNENNQLDPKSTSGPTKPMSEDSINKNSTNETSGQQESSAPQNPQLQQALLLKPRTSDAILSCPRCFNIVCMDCQKHERFANQYRAMFVMNIGVDWNKRIVYDDAVGGLKLDSVAGAARGGEDNNAPMQLDNADDATLPDTVPHDSIGHEKEELYYSVHCSYCQWELAALDMEDEIYYFFGCIASS